MFTNLLNGFFQKRFQSGKKYSILAGAGFEIVRFQIPETRQFRRAHFDRTIAW